MNSYWQTDATGKQRVCRERFEHNLIEYRFFIENRKFQKNRPNECGSKTYDDKHHLRNIK